MTFEDLNRAIGEVINSGRIGTPLSLRLHLQLAESECDPGAAAAALLPFSESAFRSSPERLSARRDSAHKQQHTLVTFVGGETLLLTVGQGFSRETTVQLLLIGNHGVVRLEGDGRLKNLPPVDDDRLKRWSAAVERSVKEKKQVAW